MKKIALIVAALAGIIFMGCKEESMKIKGEWKTTGLEINGVAQEICVSDISIKSKGFRTVAVNGNSGVNTYFGSAVVKGKNFKVKDNLASTKMAGDPRAMEFEDCFIATLVAADTWELENNNLTIKNSETGNKIVFTNK